MTKTNRVAISTVSQLKKEPLLFTLFIFIILFCSSFYLSWAIDRGMGEITVERYAIEREPDRPVDFLVYTPRLGNHLDPMPIVLTIHGLAESKESMYAFNIEIARRNFTVVSIDLAGHGDSVVPFDFNDIETLAEDAYAAVRHVQNNWDNIDNESYGVLTYSLGFSIGIELMEFPVTPKAYVATGDIKQMNLDAHVDLPGNLLITLSKYDEIISGTDVLNVLRAATENESAIAGVTYGSLANQTAYRLSFGSTDSIFQSIDRTIVQESITWLVQGVQGESRLSTTLDPTQQIYYKKTIAMVSGTFFLLVSTLPIIALLQETLPEKMKPRRIHGESITFSLRKAFIISSIFGAIIVTGFTIILTAGFQLENYGLVWLNSMAAVGIVLFYLAITAVLVISMILLMGIDAARKSFNLVGIQRISLREQLFDILKGFIIALICIVWLLFWLSLCGLPEQMQPWIALSLIKWPVNVRVINAVILMVIMIPYLVVDAAWLRGLLLSRENSGGNLGKIKTIVYAFVSKFTVMIILIAIIALGFPILGYMTGSMILLGRIILLMFIVSTLTTALMTLTALEFENTWSAIIVSAFILSIVFILGFPLI